MARVDRFSSARRHRPWLALGLAATSGLIVALLASGAVYDATGGSTLGLVVTVALVGAAMAAAAGALWAVLGLLAVRLRKGRGASPAGRLGHRAR